MQLESAKNWLLGLVDINQLDLKGDTAEEPGKCFKSGGKWVIEHDGMSMTFNEWAEYTGINRNTLYSRMRRGWSIEDMLYKPVRGSDRNSSSITKHFFEALGA